MRTKAAYIILGFSSLLKALAKLVIQKDRTIIVESLTMPGWFIIDEQLIHHIKRKTKGFPGFEWRCWPMPDEYCEQMKTLKRSK